MAGEAHPIVVESICGSTDDRTPSFDRRAGRTFPTGCTGWMMNPTTMLTAGHCTSNNRQEQIHFQVPMSTNTGGLRQPPPQHQYASLTSSMRRLNGGIGADWAVMAMVRNSNTGLYPGQLQGSWYQLGQVPSSTSGQTIRITGYGTTGGGVPRSWNQIQKTHTGPMVSNARHHAPLRVDTTGGNSGSPVIHENTGDVIGIHTHAGCNSGGGSNQGTSIARSDLQSAIRAVRDLRKAGLVLPLGTGCAGSAGTPILGSEDYADLGKSVTLNATKLVASQPGVMFLGNSNEFWNGTRLPIDLTGAGMTGCSAYISLDLPIPMASSSTGRASQTIGIPSVPALIGRAFFGQYAQVDPGANPLGVVWSNAVIVLIGD